MAKADNKLPSVINAYKEVGETPLEVIELLKKSQKKLRDVPITYAGRLDPMAEGVLLLLIGDEVHKKEDYLKLDKEYEFQVLFGFSTDTYDLLGRIYDTEDGIFNTPLFEAALKEFEGKQEQAYPPYSSKTVDGKSLFEWAREGRLHEIEIPTHKIEIKTLELIKVEMIAKEALKEHIMEKIALVKGDFRQKEILELWVAYIDNATETEFPLITCMAECSSGTYIRSVVHDLGKKLNIPTTTFSIIRTKIGEYEANS